MPRVVRPVRSMSEEIVRQLAGQDGPCLTRERPVANQAANDNWPIEAQGIRDGLLRWLMVLANFGAVVAIYVALCQGCDLLAVLD